jgi:hypothetical protein
MRCYYKECGKGSRFVLKPELGGLYGREPKVLNYYAGDNTVIMEVLNVLLAYFSRGLSGGPGQQAADHRNNDT